MKKNLLLTLFALLALTSIAQEKIFEDHFYQVHQIYKANYWGIVDATYKTDNKPRVPGNTFLWDYDYLLEAYVNVIKAESNLARKKEYTDFALDIMAYMLDKRDDNDLGRDTHFPGPLSMPNITRMDEKSPMSAGNNIKKWWASKDYYNDFKFEGNAGVSGRLTWPMAELANYILLNKSFYGSRHYRSGNNNLPVLSSRYLTPVYQTIGTNWNTNGYRKIAMDLVSKVDETFTAHFDRLQWDDINTGAGQGAFKHEWWVAGPNARNGEKGVAGEWSGITLMGQPYYLELNFQAAAGTSMLSLYNAMKTLQNPKASFYKEKLRRLGNYLRSNIQTRPSDGAWYWWYQNLAIVERFENKGFQYSNYPEDVGHAYIFADFAYYMAHYGSDISYNNGTIPVFDQANDMPKIRGLVNNIYTGNPLWFYLYINGSEKVNENLAPAYMSFTDSTKYTRADVAFIKFAKWDFDIYHRLSDVIYENIFRSDYGKFDFKLLSDLILYSKNPQNQSILKNLFRPLNVSRDPGNGSYWIAAEGGDLDGDGNANEYVAVRNVDDTFYAYRANQDGSISNIASTQIFPRPDSPATWVDLAVGSFGHSAPGQEIAAVKNYNGFEHIFLFRMDGTTFAPLASYTGFGNGSDWKGICSADLDGNGVDEIVAVRNNDGTLTSMYYDGSNKLAGFAGGTIITNIINWKSLEGGDIDGDGKDEIIGVTMSGGILIYYYENGTMKAGVVSGSGPNVAARAASLGDFDRNRKQDNLIIGDINGYFYKYKISYTGVINGKKNYKMTYETEEKFDNSWFKRAMVLGKISLSPLNCDEDKLIIIRNSDTDGHMFIFDAGYAKDNTWVCP